MRDQVWTKIYVVVGFILYAGLMLMLQGTGSGAGENAIFVRFGLLAVLLALVLYVVQRTLHRQQETLAGLREELEAQRNRSGQMQNQFAELIEKRVFELQVINGALNREIAERTQAEEEVRGLQKRLHLILDSAGEGILGIDNQGRVMFINRAASLMLGREPEELIGNGHHRLIHHTRPDGSPHPMEECPIYMAYKDGLVHYRSDDVFWGKNGASFPVEYVSTPIRDRGMLTGAVVVFRDMNTFK
ncbi:PAS domain-containing protein [Desulfoprunum benzoelyticum]|uniref:PAS domain S-box-containing protein n=1 Tax=Desulfoprunum benzoelyticum TaxID=1506996 RepID=A0A840UWD9_9BACT|nr:PAS domain-containing protein [Desulfoprunum benzoelyticum]MBB5347734.1 PAS domain S-box-containing protein [Desulfoprunum benzoelyticum]MBM9529326.1 PAS domain-containing protein [Desulfoprunum benzoelyticum]